MSAKVLNHNGVWIEVPAIDPGIAGLTVTQVKGMWTVTHAPSGRAILWGLTQTEAIAAARFLTGIDWTQTAEELRADKESVQRAIDDAYGYLDGMIG